MINNKILFQYTDAQILLTEEETNGKTAEHLSDLLLVTN
jgi:hypothetical protein